MKELEWKDDATEPANEADQRGLITSREEPLTAQKEAPSVGDDWTYSNQTSPLNNPQDLISPTSKKDVKKKKNKVKATVPKFSD